MKISNFSLLEIKGNSPLDWEYIAAVDVETGMLFWKKTKTALIRRKYCRSWHFVETGEFTPDFVVERLARSWEAKTGQSC